MSANRSEGYTEREQPLLPHEFLQLDAEHVVAFAGGTPPARLERIDWRLDRQLRDLVGLPAPAVPAIPTVNLPEWQMSTKQASSMSASTFSLDY